MFEVTTEASMSEFRTFLPFIKELLCPILHSVLKFMTLLIISFSQSNLRILNFCSSISLELVSY